MTCGKRNDHSDPNGLCSNGEHDNWLEYRDVVARNEHFRYFSRITGIAEQLLYDQFMDNSIKEFAVPDNRLIKNRGDLNRLSVSAVLEAIYNKEIGEHTVHYLKKEKLADFVLEIFNKGILNEYLDINRGIV